MTWVQESRILHLLQVASKMASPAGQSDSSTPTTPNSLWFVRVVLVISLLVFGLVTLTEHYRQKQVDTPGRQGPGPKDSFIVPGERIGLATLNLDVQLVFSEFGTPKIESTSNTTVYRFNEAGIKCTVDEGRISTILTDNPAFRTKLNTHVGSPLEDVLRDLGNDFETTSSNAKLPKNSKAAYVMHYWKKGVHFSISEEKVQSIWVTVPVGS